MQIHREPDDDGASIISAILCKCLFINRDKDFPRSVHIHRDTRSIMR